MTAACLAKSGDRTLSGGTREGASIIIASVLTITFEFMTKKKQNTPTKPQNKNVLVDFLLEYILQHALAKFQPAG